MHLQNYRYVCFLKTEWKQVKVFYVMHPESLLYSFIHPVPLQLACFSQWHFCIHGSTCCSCNGDSSNRNSSSYMLSGKINKPMVTSFLVLYTPLQGGRKELYHNMPFFETKIIEKEGERKGFALTCINGVKHCRLS